MKQVRNLFNINYYISILNGGKSIRSIFLLLMLALILTIHPSIYIFKDIYPLIKDPEQKALGIVEEIYPQELEVKIQNGAASTNVTEPYYITASQETFEKYLALDPQDDNTVSRVRLLAIDTKGKAEDFEQYQSMALLTETSFVYYRDGDININSLRDVEDMTINKNIVVEKIKEISKTYNINTLVTVFLFIAPVFIFVGLLITQLLVFLFLSLVVYLMVRINKTGASFKNTFRYTAALAFIPILLWNILSFIPQISWILISATTLLTIIVLVLAYFGIEKVKELHKSI